MMGIPLDAEGNFIGGFFDLLSPYALLAGVVAVALFAMHGAMYLFLKLPAGEARERVGLDVAHVGNIPGALHPRDDVHAGGDPTLDSEFQALSLGRAVVVLNVLAVANIPRAVYQNRPVQAFASSALTIVCLVALFGIALLPNLVTASNNPAEPDHLQRRVEHRYAWPMFIIVIIGMPFVLAYTTAVYWTFRGRVELGEHSY